LTLKKTNSCHLLAPFCIANYVLHVMRALLRRRTPMNKVPERNEVDMVDLKAADVNDLSSFRLL